jgi:hypothetical protein
MSLPMASGMNLATRSLRSQLLASRDMMSTIFLRMARIWGGGGEVCVVVGGGGGERAGQGRRGACISHCTIRHGRGCSSGHAREGKALTPQDAEQVGGGG